jgi:hypothetical protein
MTDRDRRLNRHSSGSGARGVLVGVWVVICVVAAGVASVAWLGTDTTDERAERATPSSSTRPSDEEAPVGLSPSTTAEPDEQTPPPSASDAPEPAEEAEPVEEGGASGDAPPVTSWLPGDSDGDGALVDDLDKDGDGILDDWVAPDDGIGTYKPGDQAVDGEFEEDRREEAGCEPAYEDACVPPAPPVLTCEQAGVSNLLITSGGDPHGFDTDFDGVGCESQGEGEEEIPADLDPPDTDGD